jgi:hypothetical protein
MALIELRVSLEITSPSCKPEVRAWIDLEPDIGLDSEVELPLRQLSGPEWVGCFTLAQARPQRFLYRLGLAAEAGVDWSLRVHSRRSRRDILLDGDTLATAKCWLVGSCCVPRTEHRRVAGMASALSAERADGARSPERDPHLNVVYLDRYRPR